MVWVKGVQAAFPKWERGGVYRRTHLDWGREPGRLCPRGASGSDGGHLRTEWSDTLKVDGHPGSAAPLGPVED